MGRLQCKLAIVHVIVVACTCAGGIENDVRGHATHYVASNYKVLDFHTVVNKSYRCVVVFEAVF